MSKELEDLQTHIAFQELTISELNSALISQQQQLDVLKLEIRLLKEKLGELEDRVESGPRDPAQEKPPHY